MEEWISWAVKTIPASILLYHLVCESLKVFFNKIEDHDAPEWLHTSSRISKKVLEFISSNDDHIPKEFRERLEELEKKQDEADSDSE